MKTTSHAKRYAPCNTKELSSQHNLVFQIVNLKELL